MGIRTVVSLFVLLATLASPALGQAESWQRKWYWGAQGGVYSYEVPTTTGREFAIGAGGHWLITGKRSALYFGFDQWMFPDSSTSAILDPTVPSGIRLVDFSQGRRIQALLYAMPLAGNVQIMLGGGFAINQITNAVPQGPFATVTEAENALDIVAEVDTRAFMVFGGGAQYRLGKLAVFGQYHFMPAASNFLLIGEQHVLTAGVRYILGSAHEDVATNK